MTSTVDRARPDSRSHGAVHRITEMLLGAAPTVAFLVTDGVSGSLVPAIVAAAIVAAAGFGWKVLRHDRLRSALPGPAIVAVCAGVAAATGEERGFFLVPTLIPFAVIALCLATLVRGRPLTGLLLNRVAGGPADWPRVPRLRRVYVASTLVAVIVNAFNGIVQVVFYRADDPVVLGVAHIATGPVFAVLVAATLVFARRAVPRPATVVDRGMPED